MIIDLERVFNGGINSLEINFDLDFSSIDIDGVHPFTTPVKVTGVVENRTDIVYINCVADCVFHGVCNRCAEPFEKIMNVPVDHILVSELNDEDNDEFILAENMQLDIEQLVLEDVMLSLPMIILCREECKGMCSQCGKNLNKGKCDCKKEIDPRWAALQQLLDD